MRSMLWVTRPESCAAAQHEAMQARLRDEGWQITLLPYQHRMMWRRRQSSDVLVWTFVPTQLEVWLAKRVAGTQYGLIHELPAHVDSLPGLDHWLTPSQSLCDALCSAGASAKAVSVSAFLPRPDRASTVDVRGELGLAGDTPLIYSPGPLAPQAGNRIAIWALNILNYVHPETRLIVHGDGAERERLVEFSHSIDEHRRVHFAPAGWPMADLVASADQVWLPRQWDGVPDALFVAMQHGKPIVAARQKSLAEWLGHERNALLVRPDQPAEWAAAAHRLFELPALASALGDAVRQSATFGTAELPPFGTSPQRRPVMAA